MKEILRAIVNMYRETWLQYNELLKEYPENELADYKRKLYFAKYCIADQATIDYEAGVEIDLNDLARRLDGVRVQPPSWATK